MEEEELAEGGDDLMVLREVANIVSAYLSNNALPAADLPEFIISVHASVRLLLRREPATEAKPSESPAVSIKKSLNRDFLVCLEDGKRFKSLRRHLSSNHQMTPDEYRAKWSLPNDYPMVAPAYSAVRSKLAKHSGLGQLAKANDAESDAPEVGDSRANGSGSMNGMTPPAAFPEAFVIDSSLDPSSGDAASRAGTGLGAAAADGASAAPTVGAEAKTTRRGRSRKTVAT